MISHASRTPWILLLCVLGAAIAAPAIGSGNKKGKKTHLGVPASEIVNIETFQVPNNNSGGSGFFYDRQATPFTVPSGFSFVVTDIFVEPTGTTVNDSKYYLVVIDLGGRGFTEQFGGSATHHTAFQSGMVIPAGGAVSARNTTFSATPVDVRMQGYFVEGLVPPPGTSPF